MGHVFTSRSKQPSSPYALVREIASRRMPAGFLSVAMLAITIAITIAIILGFDAVPWLKSVEVTDHYLIIVGGEACILFGYSLAYFVLGTTCRRSLDSFRDGSDSPLDEGCPDPL